MVQYKQKSLSQGVCGRGKERMKKGNLRGCSYVLYDFMGERLGLGGNTLLVFAMIYSFSRDGVGFYLGSQEYLADKIRASARSVGRALKQLEEQGYVTKLVADTKCRVCYRVAERFFDDNIDRTLASMPVLKSEESEEVGTVGRYPEDGRAPNWHSPTTKCRSRGGDGLPNWLPPTTKCQSDTDKLAEPSGQNVSADTTKCQSTYDKLSDNNKLNNKSHNELHNKFYNRRSAQDEGENKKKSSDKGMYQGGYDPSEFMSIERDDPDYWQKVCDMAIYRSLFENDEDETVAN